MTASPFYDSASHEINVGNYSEQLETFKYDELSALVDEMTQNKADLTPEQMFVLAIKLFELGDNDNAVYWFYEAQFRAKLFLIALDPDHIGSIGDPSFELPAAYNAFTQLSGDYINAYTGCDIENWTNIATMVKNHNPTPPDLTRLFPDVVFVAKSQWSSLNELPRRKRTGYQRSQPRKNFSPQSGGVCIPTRNQQVAEGLDGLINYLSANKEAVMKEREAKNLDAQYCR